MPILSNPNHPAMTATLNFPPRRAPDVKSWLFRTVFSRVGPSVKAGVSYALGVIVVKLAAFGIELDANMQAHISYVLTGLAWLTIDQIINRYAGKQAVAIQSALGVEADEWIGPKTVQAAEIRKPLPLP
jgi:hypothetical protein